MVTWPTDAWNGGYSKNQWLGHAIGGWTEYEECVADGVARFALGCLVMGIVKRMGSLSEQSCSETRLDH